MSARSPGPARGERPPARSDSEASIIYGAYTALVYIAPVVGGYLADQYIGQRKAVLIGAGIGAQHMAGYAALPDRFSVKNICELNEARGRALADQYDGVGFTNDLAAVLADPGIDIVDICLPPHLHFRTCMAALDAERWLDEQA